MAAVVSSVTVEFHSESGATPALDFAAVEAARLVHEARNKLITTAGSVTTDMLTDGRMSTANATRQWIHRHRTSGRLITIDDDGRVLIPSYQLGEAFDLKPVVADVTETLTGVGMSSWAIWRWFVSHNGWLDSTPLEALERGGIEAVGPALEGLLTA